MDGKKNLKSVSIKPDADDPEDVEMLEDLIQAAFQDASRQVDESVGAKFGDMSGGTPGRNVVPRHKGMEFYLCLTETEKTRYSSSWMISRDYREIGPKSAQRLVFYLLKQPQSVSDDAVRSYQQAEKQHMSQLDLQQHL